MKKFLILACILIIAKGACLCIEKHYEEKPYSREYLQGDVND